MESDDSDADRSRTCTSSTRRWDNIQPDEQPQEPDWELVERLKELLVLMKPRKYHPEIPEAPSLPNLEEPTSEEFHSWLTEEE